MTERNEAQVLIDAYNALEALAAQVLAGKQALTLHRPLGRWSVKFTNLFGGNP